MNGVKYLLISLAILSSFTACGPKMISKGESFPGMYNERPLSILVLPPINESTAADAKEYYSTTIAETLSETGYYVYSLEVVSDILKNEGLYDTEVLVNTPPQKFKEFFGADAVMYIHILKWNTSYYVIGGNVTVAVAFLLKSTETGEELWKYDGTVVVNTSGNVGGGGLGGLIAGVIATAIQTAATSYIPVAKQANQIALISIPYGKYHPQYGKDQDAKVVLESKVKKADPKEEKVR